MESSPQNPEVSSAGSALTPAVDRGGSERLTIRRFLILTAGVAVSLGIFRPTLDPPIFVSIDDWLQLSVVFLVGLALPAPLFTVRLHRRQTPLGPGSLFALTSGLGSLLLLAPVAIATMTGGKNDMALTCLGYCLPLMGAWYLLAAALSGHLGRRLFRPETPWTERYGFLLAALWTPWGIWHLIQIYLQAL